MGAACILAACAAIAITTALMTVRAADTDKAEASRNETLLREEFARIPNRIVYESRQDGNWDLFVSSPDGSHASNLTHTPDVDELYPHASPDGERVCFVVDEGEDKAKVRNVYYMNIDGSERKLVARNARQPCWSPDGKTIAYLGGEFEEFCYRDFATKGILFYDIETGKHREHPNKNIHHLYNLCWSPCGKWFVATVHGGMGYKHTNLAIEADGQGVYNLGIGGCRPDISPDGKHIAWGSGDWSLSIADLDLTGPKPKVANKHNLIISRKPTKVYHVDWSPDGKYVTFSRGPATKSLGMAPEIVGIKAEGWDICVARAAGRNQWIAITSNGSCNKEPDWVPVRKKEQ